MSFNLCLCTATTLLKQKNQLEFYLGSITAKNDEVLGLAKNYYQIKPQEDQVATARTPTPSESVHPRNPFHSVLRLHQ